MGTGRVLREATTHLTGYAEKLPLGGAYAAGVTVDDRSHEAIWLWVAGAFLAVTIGLVGGYAGRAHHIDPWVPLMIAAYVCGIVAIVCLGGALRGWRFPFAKGNRRHWSASLPAAAEESSPRRRGAANPHPTSPLGQVLREGVRAAEEMDRLGMPPSGHKGAAADGHDD
jgi:hypothetical protein